MVGWHERPDRKEAKQDSSYTFTVARKLCRGSGYFQVLQSKDVVHLKGI